MKRIIILLATVTILGSSCNNKNEKTALQFLTPYVNFPEYLNGRIKQVHESNYWAVIENKKWVKGEVLSRAERDSLGWSNDFTAQYDESGIISRVDNILFEGEVRSFVTKTENGLLKKATYVKGGENSVYMMLNHNEKGHIVSSKRFREKVDTLLSYYTFETNEDGCITSSKLYNYKGELSFSYELNLNDENLTESMKTYSADDSLMQDYRMMYNKKGFYSKTLILNGLNQIRRNLEVKYTKYDRKGNWLSAWVYDDGKPMVITKREYEYY